MARRMRRRAAGAGARVLPGPAGAAMVRGRKRPAPASAGPRAAVKPLFFGAVLAGLTALAWKEIPALRRELKIWMM